MIETSSDIAGVSNDVAGKRHQNFEYQTCDITDYFRKVNNETHKNNFMFNTLEDIMDLADDAFSKASNENFVCNTPTTIYTDDEYVDGISLSHFYDFATDVADVADVANTVSEKEIFLSGSHITEIPEKFKNFTLIETIKIEGTKISELKNLPPNITTLSAKGNVFKIVDGNEIPESVKNLELNNNSIIRLINLKNGIDVLELCGNSFEEIESIIPKSVTNLRLSTNQYLKKLPLFEENGVNLKILSICNTMITNIDDLPPNITSLESCYCEIKEVNNLPQTLLVWKSYSTKLESINCDFPPNLVEADFFNCNLTKCPPFPCTIEKIDLGRNCLTEIPFFPPTTESIDLKDNTNFEISDIDKLRGEMPNVKILFNHQVSFGGYYNTFESLFNNNMDDNTSTRSRWRNTMTHSEFREDNPHYILLKKIYTV